MVDLVGKRGCAVDLAAGRSPAQRLVLIGEGYTEAVSCGRLLAFGRLPSPRGTWRIGFLYRAYSPNATVTQPVVIRRDAAGGRWTVDDELSQAISERGQLVSIPAIRAWLRRTRR